MKKQKTAYERQKPQVMQQVERKGGNCLIAQVMSEVERAGKKSE